MDGVVFHCRGAVADGCCSRGGGHFCWKWDWLGCGSRTATVKFLVKGVDLVDGLAVYPPGGGRLEG